MLLNLTKCMNIYRFFVKFFPYKKVAILLMMRYNITHIECKEGRIKFNDDDFSDFFFGCLWSTFGIETNSLNSIGTCNYLLFSYFYSIKSIFFSTSQLAFGVDSCRERIISKWSNFFWRVRDRFSALFGSMVDCWSLKIIN